MLEEEDSSRDWEFERAKEIGRTQDSRSRLDVGSVVSQSVGESARVVGDAQQGKPAMQRGRWDGEGCCGFGQSQ